MSSSQTGSKSIAQSLSISSKIQSLMARITTIIKELDASNQEDALGKLNRSLYRAMDNLMEFELELLRLKVPYTNWHNVINHMILCPACGKQWPHAHDFDHASYKH